MPSLAEVTASIRAAWGLLFWDAGAFGKLNLTISGFWRSFAAPLASYPAFLVYVLAGQAAAVETRALVEQAEALPPVPSTQSVILASTLSFLVMLALFPLVMIPFTRFLQVTRGYVTLVIGRNWLSAVMIHIVAAPSLFYLAGILSAAALTLLSLLAVLASWGGRFFIAWRSLGDSTLIGGAVLAIDILLSILLAQVVGLLFL